MRTLKKVVCICETDRAIFEIMKSFQVSVNETMQHLLINLICSEIVDSKWMQHQEVCQHAFKFD